MAAIFDDQLVPDEATSQAGVALPTNWESQYQCVQIYDLISSAEDCKLRQNDAKVNAGYCYKCNRNSKFMAMGSL